ncbi:MAG: hypothetical protein Q8R24_05060 [Legionellaceae bacterium]|nr:hypothetical protein [Legionellaceae bacterium]
MIKRILNNVNQQNMVHASKSTILSQRDQPFFIDVGGSGFRAVAVWIMGYLLGMNSSQHTTIVKKHWATTIFERHIRYFPIHQTLIDVLVGSDSTKRHMVSDRLKREFIDTLAYTLGRIAFDELCHNPVPYRGAFSHGQTERLRDFMHAFLPQPDKFSMGALAKALHLSIEIWHVNTTSDIPARYHYGTNKHEHNSDIQMVPVLQLQAETYFMPLVSDAVWERVLNHPIHSSLKPVSEQITCCFTLAELHAKLSAADEEIINRFIHIKANLVAMVQAGDLTLSHLKSIYNQGLYETNRQRTRIGTECGNQYYFADITSSSEGVMPTLMPFSSYDAEIMEQLLTAIARAVSLDEMSLDLIDSYL